MPLLVAVYLGAFVACVALFKNGFFEPARSPAGMPGGPASEHVFAVYVSPDGYALNVPLGWGQKSESHRVRFSSGRSVITVELSSPGTSSTVQQIGQEMLSSLKRRERAVQVIDVHEIHVERGAAIKLVYNCNSEPSALSSLQYRMENEEFLYLDGGKLLTVHFAAPIGGDHGRQWEAVEKSLRWI